MWVHWADGIHPEFRDVAEEVQVVDEVKFHDYVEHLLTSERVSRTAREVVLAPRTP